MDDVWTENTFSLYYCPIANHSDQVYINPLHLSTYLPIYLPNNQQVVYLFTYLPSYEPFTFGLPTELWYSPSYIGSYLQQCEVEGEWFIGQVTHIPHQFIHNGVGKALQDLLSVVGGHVPHHNFSSMKGRCFKKHVANFVDVFFCRNVLPPLFFGDT